jgi:isopenicillin-N N-acyltransferase-like protein
LLRHSGLETLMQDRRGMLSASTMKELLSDHDGHPGSICRHHQPGQLAPVKTIYSVICEPDAGRMHLRLGNPCQGPYQVFEFD